MQAFLISWSTHHIRIIKDGNTIRKSRSNTNIKPWSQPTHEREEGENTQGSGQYLYREGPGAGWSSWWQSRWREWEESKNNREYSKIYFVFIRNFAGKNTFLDIQIESTCRVVAYWIRGNEENVLGATWLLPWNSLTVVVRGLPLILSVRIPLQGSGILVP